MMTIKHTTINYTKNSVTLVVALLLLSFNHVSLAGELRSIDWVKKSKEPTIELKVSGKSKYQTASLEKGKRLRFILLDSELSGDVSELTGQGDIKGVYPYLGESGNQINVDILTSEPSKLSVEKTRSGYRITTLPGAEQLTAEEEQPGAQDTASNTIEEIAYAKLPGDRVQLTVRMSGPPQEPRAFTISEPARIALDFQNTDVNMPQRSVQVREGALSTVTAIGAGDRARVVLSLVSPVGYNASIKGNNYVLTLDAPTPDIKGADIVKPSRFAGEKAGQEGKYNVRDIDFRRGRQGEGTIVISLSDPTVGVDIRDQSGEIIVDILNTSVPLDLQRRLDVIDFATPVQTIDTFQNEKNTRMVIIPKGKYEHIAYQSEDVFTISISPVVESEEEEKVVDEFGYSGEKLSLNFQNIPVRSALLVLAEFTELNFVISDTVQGDLTLELRDVPWDQALDLIMETKRLGMRRIGNVISIAPAEEIAAREKAQLEATKTVFELEPLQTELIQINYAKADEIAALLKSVTAIEPSTGQSALPFSTVSYGGDVQTDSNSLLSPRGQVTVDLRTNSILIQDTASQIRQVRQLISKLDRPVRQVMIETRLVEATTSFAKSIGVRWGHLSDRSRGQSRVISTGHLETLEDYVNTGSYTYLPDGLNVNFPAPGQGNTPASAFTFAFFHNSDIIDMELSAIEAEGDGKVISSPRLITANQKQASIEQGQEREFSTGFGTFKIQKAVLKLDVTPQITPDDRIIMDVIINKDSFEDVQQGLINTKEITTQVLLDNGETIVIGGVYELTRNEDHTKVPFFGDIPLLGWLFKSKDFTDNKTELLIFLTPKIISEALGIE